MSLLALWASGALSLNTFAFLSLASFFTGVMFIEGRLKYSLLTFAVVSLLGFVLPVDRMSLIYYVCFFGYYPIIKSYIERINKLSVEIIIKTVFFFIISFSLCYGIISFTGQSLSDKIPWQGVAIIGVLVLHIFDYVLSILFDFYVKKIRTKIKR